MYSMGGYYPDGWSSYDQDCVNDIMSKTAYEDTVSEYEQQIRELDEELEACTDDDERAEIAERIEELHAELDNFTEENDYYD